MRHHTAIEVDLAERGKGWHYASLHRTGGHPLGYCAQHPPHATQAEARTCYQQYRRDNVALDVQLSWTTCHLCPNPAQTGARILYDGFAQAALCADHLTMDHAMTALGLNDDEAGDTWVF